MGGKGSGNRTKSNPRIAKRADSVDPDVNSKAIQYTKALMKLPQCDLSSEEEVEERVDLFCDNCESDIHGDFVRVHSVFMTVDCEPYEPITVHDDGDDFILCDKCYGEMIKGVVDK